MSHTKGEAESASDGWSRPAVTIAFILKGERANPEIFFWKIMNSIPVDYMRNRHVDNRDFIMFKGLIIFGQKNL